MVKANSARHWLRRLMVLLSIVSLSACLDFSGVGAGESSGNPVTVSEGSGNHTLGVLALYAGALGGAGSADGTGSAARFDSPRGLTIDTNGNLYVADANNETIRKITPAGVVSTLAGSAGQSGSIDGSGSAARFNRPSGLTIDASGNLYVADMNNHTIRKITPAGVVSTLAGSAGQGGSNDGIGSAARLRSPHGLSIDANSNLYVADMGNHTVRKITPAGVVSTLAGSAGQAGSTDGIGSVALFRNPYDLAVDASGNLYVADTVNNTIRTITPGGVVSTLAGSAGQVGSSDGSGNVARFYSPSSVSIGANGNLYVTDAVNHTIRTITPGGVVSTLAGSAGQGGATDGSGSAARFFTPHGLTIDAAGSLFVADTGNNTIRKITPTGIVSTLAGSARQNGSIDGSGSTARFAFPEGVALDSHGTLYVADSNCTIRAISTARMVSTLAGNPGECGSSDGSGAAAQFGEPSGVAVDASGMVYVADSRNQTIRKITSSGVVTTVAGSAGVVGSADGVGGGARFNYPHGLSLDSGGNLYVADYGNHTIRKITPSGVVSTLAGSAGQNGSADGTGVMARFNKPSSVVFDSGGNLFVSDEGNHVIRKITPAGIVTTFAGSAGQTGSMDGNGVSARFNFPRALTIDPSDNLYVADYVNHTIRKITPVGMVTTIAGVPGQAGVQPGNLPASLSRPHGLAFGNINGVNTLFVSSSVENSILSITLP